MHRRNVAAALISGKFAKVISGTVDTPGKAFWGGGSFAALLATVRRMPNSRQSHKATPDIHSFLA